MDSIGTTRVQDIMVTNIVTVKETDKMEFVAQLFKENDINAAPVIDENDKCIGVISSHNLVEYESVRRKMENELNHGMCYDLAHYGSGGQFRMPGQHFDEVGFHMNKTIQSAAVDDTLSHVARTMCTSHLHHVLVLDESQHPIGLLSSLDILGFLIGEPVHRSSK